MSFASSEASAIAVHWGIGSSESLPIDTVYLYVYVDTFKFNSTSLGKETELTRRRRGIIGFTIIELYKLKIKFIKSNLLHC